ncbi:helix-turn-helix transcriptional regulator [Lysobacter sp. Root494]|uniref:helix-turn-helix transcriptional regulator n=1 Tax=Lysobacter sp. Root494 TaxID=1736549 RepID=UPI0006F7FF59|nr:helix-turn-helix transcriptional regulator [Lysobacter sp. Root494]KQY52805.1 XRE family transcriptional regulator [Lysobacter sp. Root494]
MPNIGALLKSEITRLARKEVRAEVTTLRKASVGYRRDIAALKRVVADLQRQVAASSRASKRAQPANSGQATPARFSAKALQSHRARLGMSASDYGRLAGVSGQSIYNYEAGKAVPRQSQIAALAAVRALGKREASDRLERM